MTDIRSLLDQVARKAAKLAPSTRKPIALMLEQARKDRRGSPLAGMTDDERRHWLRDLRRRLGRMPPRVVRDEDEHDDHRVRR